jgi:hypothetical protein
MPDSDRENQFVDAFIASAKRDRYRSLLANPHKRSKILNLLNHNLDLDWSLAKQVKGSELESTLLALGASRQGCYFISDCRELDGTTLSLADGIRLAEECQSGSVLDCIPGKLAVHWNELGRNRACYLLELLRMDFA